MDNGEQQMRDLLSHYLDNDLTEQERKEVEARLAMDEKWRQELESSKQVREAVRLYGLRQDKKEVPGSTKQSNPPIRQISQARRIIRFSFSIAAAILLIFLGITVFNFYKLSPRKVVTENYISYELPSHHDGEGKVTTVEKAYRAGDFEKAVSDSTQANSASDKMLVAHAFVELNKYPEAISYYKKVIEATHPTRDKILYDAGQYYLSRAFIYNKDYDYALSHLAIIHSDPSHTYHENVTGKLIRQVKMLKWR
jgi:predicted negative regulator of RcsB-dependent stress response